MCIHVKFKIDTATIKDTIHIKNNIKYFTQNFRFHNNKNHYFFNIIIFIISYVGAQILLSKPSNKLGHYN